MRGLKCTSQLHHLYRRHMSFSCLEGYLIIAWAVNYGFCPVLHNFLHPILFAMVKDFLLIHRFIKFSYAETLQPVR